MNMAKNKKEIDPKYLNGLSIYHDEKRTVYAPFFSKKAYIINEKNAKEYVSYIQGYLIALLIFAVVYIVTKNPLIGIMLAVTFIISNLVVFYMNFIKKASVIENYNKAPRDNFAIRQARSLDRKNIITIIICCPLLALAFMLNSYFNKFTGAALYLSIAAAVASLLYGALHIYILIYKDRNL